MRSKAEATAFFDDCERERRAKEAGSTISGLMKRVIKRESTIIDDPAFTTKLTIPSPLTEISMNSSLDIPHSRSTDGTGSLTKTPLKRKHDNPEEESDRPRRSSRLKQLKTKGDGGSTISVAEGRQARVGSKTKATLRQSISAKYLVRPPTPAKVSRKSTRKEKPPPMPSSAFPCLAAYSLRSRSQKNSSVPTKENDGTTSNSYYTT